MSILTVIEGAVVAIVAGALKEDIGWGIAAFIIFMILYCVPILRETLSIMASLVEAMIVYELVNLITSNTIAWFISLVAFFVILGIHVSFEEFEYNIGILGYSLVIFEAIMIGVALRLEYSLTWQAVAIPVLLIILSVVPFVRIAEYTISALGTAYVLYIIALESVDNVSAIISSVIVFLFSGGYYIAAYSQMNYKTVFENIIENRKLKKLERIYPLIKSSQEYDGILKRCQSEIEKAQFRNDWKNYKLALQSTFSASPKQKPTELAYSFREWYDRNRRWETTSYYHAYYEEQEYADRRRLDREDKALRNWKCEFCGRINDESVSACISCGALRK